MPTMNTTANYGFPLPFGTNELKDDILRLINAIVAIDANEAAIAAILAGKAPLNAPVFINPQGTTQAGSDNSTKLATTAFVKSAIAALVGSSPATLDTLNEIATALGNDPNFATTITNALASKFSTSGGTITGNTTVSAGFAVSGISTFSSYVYEKAPNATSNAAYGFLRSDTTVAGFTYWDYTTNSVYLQAMNNVGGLVSSLRLGCTTPALEFNGQQVMLGRNRLINADMRVAQRGTTISVTGQAYTLDRWQVTTSGTGVSVSQVAGPTGFRNAMRITGAAGNTGVNIRQPIESMNASDMALAPCAIQTVLSASTPQTVLWELRYANTLDNFSTTPLIANGTWSVTTTPTKFTAVTGNLPAAAANGLLLMVYLNNGGAFTSGTFDFTGAQLEPGTVPTAFEFVSYPTQLMRCQRYYEKSYDTNVAVGTATFSGAKAAIASGLSVYIQIDYKVAKRAFPTITAYSPLNGAAGNLGTASVNIAATIVYSAHAGCLITGSGIAVDQNGYGVHFVADAEL